MSDSEITMTLATARRVANAVRIVERMPRSTVQGPTKPRIILPTKCGITTTVMTARVGKTPGYVTVQPYTFDGTIFNLSGPTIKVWNWTGSTLTVTPVWIEYNIVDGYPFFLGNDCSGEAP